MYHKDYEKMLEIIEHETNCIELIIKIKNDKKKGN